MEVGPILKNMITMSCFLQELIVINTATYLFLLIIACKSVSNDFVVSIYTPVKKCDYFLIWFSRMKKRQEEELKIKGKSKVQVVGLLKF